MRLAFSTNTFMHLPFSTAAARIQALGYEGLELRADVPHAWPAGMRDGAKRNMRAAMRNYGLAFSNVNAFRMEAVGDYRNPNWYPSFLEADEGYRRVRIDHTRRALSLCAELGAPHVSTLPGGLLAPGQSRQAALDRFVEALKPLAEYAHNLGVALLIEPEPSLLVATTDQYLEVAERVGAPSLGLNFDIGHAYCVGEDLPRQIHRLAAHTKHYHIEDMAATRVHHHLVPGTGAIDIPAVVGAIRQTGYGGWLTVELDPLVDDPDAAGRQARAFLQPLIEAA